MKNEDVAIFEIASYIRFDKESSKRLLSLSGLKVGKCKECNNGWIILLTSRTKCKECNGIGKRLVSITNK